MSNYPQARVTFQPSGRTETMLVLYHSRIGSVLVKSMDGYQERYVPGDWVEMIPDSGDPLFDEAEANAQSDR